jgi:hypothetical protein
MTPNRLICLPLALAGLLAAIGCNRSQAPEPSPAAQPSPRKIHLIAIDPGVGNVDVAKFLTDATEADDEEHQIFVFSGTARDLAPLQLGTVAARPQAEVAGNIRGAGREALLAQARTAARAARADGLKTILEELARSPVPKASLLVENLRALAVLAKDLGPAVRITVMTDLLETQVGKLSLERSDPRDPRTAAAFAAYVKAGGGPLDLERVRIVMPLTLCPGPGLPPMGTTQVKALQALWVQAALPHTQVEFKTLQTVRTPSPR